MAAGWAIAPVVGSGTDESPIRPQLADREGQDGDRLEHVIGNRNRCLVAFDVADPSNFADHGGIVLADLADLDEAMSRLPAAKRQRVQTLAADHEVDGTGRLREVLRRVGRRLDGNFHEAAHLGRGSAPVPGSFVNDSFTDTSGTGLASHTGETGATWTEHGSYTAGDAVISDANRARWTNTSSGGYYASGAPASAEYDVAAVVRRVTNSGSMFINGRMETGADTLYCVDVTAASCRMYKIVAGTATSLGTYTTASADGTNYSITLEIRDAAKKFYLAGTERISSTDNVITAAGKVGIRGSHGSNTTGYHLDSITATDAGGVARRKNVRSPGRAAR